MSIPDKRVIMRIELRSDAKDKLNACTEQQGMTQVSTMSRLLEWFAFQPVEVQQLVMRKFPESITPDVTKLILKRMERAK